jgi:hypothetical protein
MKKIILPTIIFLLFLTSVLAENFDMRIVKYDAKTGNARIQIYNKASTDLHDLKMEIDDIIELKIAQFVRADSSFSTFVTLTPGKHDITLTTSEGITTTKQLYFSPSEEQIKAEVEIQATEEEAKKLGVETQQTQQPITSGKTNVKYIYALFGLIAIIVIYFLYKKLR